MANLSSNVKTVFLKGLEALGKTASSLSDAASQKLSEMNLENRRREVLAQIPKCVMQLWKDGVELPEPLTALLDELTDVESKLAAMRPKQEAPAAQPTAEADEAPVEEPAEDACETDEAPCEEAASECDLPADSPSFVCPAQEQEPIDPDGETKAAVEADGE